MSQIIGLLLENKHTVINEKHTNALTCVLEDVLSEMMVNITIMWTSGHQGIYMMIWQIIFLKILHDIYTRKGI